MNGNQILGNKKAIFHDGMAKEGNTSRVGDRVEKLVKAQCKKDGKC